MKINFEKAAQAYVAPVVEVTEVLMEGVLCASGGNEGWEWGEGNE